MPENNERKDFPMDETDELNEMDETAEIAAESEEITEEIVEDTDKGQAEAEESDEVSFEEDALFDESDEDEDNLAAVAERIMGARHTVAATAAPVRIRDATGHIPTVPKPTAGIPVRPAAAVKPEEAVSPKAAVQTKAAHKRMFVTVVASSLALIAILSALIVIVNGFAEKNRPADINMGETFGEAEIIDPENDETDRTDTLESESDTIEPNTETEDPETQAPDDTDDTDGSAQESETETETESETETEPPETVPEPVKFTVTLDFYDREDITVVTEAITFADLLSSVECTLTDTDVPSVDMNSMIAADTTVTIGKLEYKTEAVTETLAYETEVIEIDTIPRGTTNYIQYGASGELTKTYTVEYLNGVERSRTLASEQTTKWPVNEVYELGVGGEFVGADGVTYTYSHRRVVPATYYNIEGPTYLGTMADETVIAVDRDYIPLETKLYVKNDKYDFGVRIASDVGSMIEGWEVDIWIDDSNPQLESFAKIGYHYDMEIYYID